MELKKDEREGLQLLSQRYLEKNPNFHQACIQIRNFSLQLISISRVDAKLEITFERIFQKNFTINLAGQDQPTWIILALASKGGIREKFEIWKLKGDSTKGENQITILRANIT